MRVELNYIDRACSVKFMFLVAKEKFQFWKQF